MIDPGETAFLDYSATVSQPGDGNILRTFDARIIHHGEDRTETIGTVRGWVGWAIWADDVWDAADEISADAEMLGSAVVEIIASCTDVIVDHVLLIDRIHLDPQWRGLRLSGAIIDGLLDLFRLDPDGTVVVLHPEPQQMTGGPYELGKERDEAVRRLTAAYRSSGLEQWSDGPVWWRPLDSEAMS